MPLALEELAAPPPPALALLLLLLLASALLALEPPLPDDEPTDAAEVDVDEVDELDPQAKAPAPSATGSAQRTAILPMFIVDQPGRGGRPANVTSSETRSRSGAS